MRAKLVLATIALPVTLAVAAVGAHPPRSADAAPAATPAPAPDAVNWRAAEISRIRAHFDSVLSELHARDIGRIGGEVRSNRARLLTTLRDYRDAGEFPRNYDFPGQAVPYFVDRETGILCAVAHLLESTGRRDIVNRVAGMNNNVYVAELAGDAEFAGWLDVNGLTLAEAARIQVPYMFDGPEPAPSIEARGAGSAGTTLSSVALAGALGATLWNARAGGTGSSRLGNVLGMTSGLAALGAGAATLGEANASPVLGVATIAAGAASAWIAGRGIMRQRDANARRTAERATITPVVSTNGNAGAGVSLNLRF